MEKQGSAEFSNQARLYVHAITLAKLFSVRCIILSSCIGTKRESTRTREIVIKFNQN